MFSTRIQILCESIVIKDELVMYTHWEMLLVLLMSVHTSDLNHWIKKNTKCFVWEVFISMINEIEFVKGKFYIECKY